MAHTTHVVYCATPKCKHKFPLAADATYAEAAAAREAHLQAAPEHDVRIRQ